MSLECDACEEPARRLDSIGTPGSPGHEVSMRLCSDHDGYSKQFHRASNDGDRAAAKEQFEKQITKKEARPNAERLLDATKSEKFVEPRPLSWKELHADDAHTRDLGRSL